nr:MAG TPA: hypothetical protein [Caudoviricetes sp.]
MKSENFLKGFREKLLIPETNIKIENEKIFPETLSGKKGK